MQKMKQKQKELESRVKNLESENKHLLRENGDLKKMKGDLNKNVKNYDCLKYLRLPDTCLKRNCMENNFNDS